MSNLHDAASPWGITEDSVTVLKPGMRFRQLHAESSLAEIDPDLMWMGQSNKTQGVQHHKDEFDRTCKDF